MFGLTSEIRKAVLAPAAYICIPMHMRDIDAILAQAGLGFLCRMSLAVASRHDDGASLWLPSGSGGAVVGCGLLGLVALGAIGTVCCCACYGARAALHFWNRRCVEARRRRVKARWQTAVGKVVALHPPRRDRSGTPTASARPLGAPLREGFALREERDSADPQWIRQRRS